MPTVFMHRLISGVHEGGRVDHINGDTLDNRRSNLRICTHSQNLQNQAMRSDNSSGFKGVHWDRQNNRWRTIVTVMGKQIHIGLYSDKIEAAIAYNEAATKHFGEFALLNTIPDNYSI